MSRGTGEHLHTGEWTSDPFLSVPRQEIRGSFSGECDQLEKADVVIRTARAAP